MTVLYVNRMNYSWDEVWITGYLKCGKFVLISQYFSSDFSVGGHCDAPFSVSGDHFELKGSLWLKQFVRLVYCKIHVR